MLSVKNLEKLYICTFMLYTVGILNGFFFAFTHGLSFGNLSRVLISCNLKLLCNASIKYTLLPLNDSFLNRPVNATSSISLMKPNEKRSSQIHYLRALLQPDQNMLCYFLFALRTWIFTNFQVLKRFNSNLQDDTQNIICTT